MKSVNETTFLLPDGTPHGASRLTKGLLAGALAAGVILGHTDDTTHKAVFGTSITHPEVTYDPLSWIDTPIHEVVDDITTVVIPAGRTAVAHMFGGGELFSPDEG